MLTTTARGHVALKGSIGIPSTYLVVYVRVYAGVLFLGNTAGRYGGISELAFLVGGTVKQCRISGLVGLAGKY